MPSYTIASITDTPALDVVGRRLALESGGRLWATYSKKPSGYTYQQVYCAYSDDDGQTWTETQVTDTDTDHHFFPIIAIDSDDDIHIAYTASGRGAFPNSRSLLYMKRTSGSWGSEEEIALKDVINPGQNRASLAIDSADDVHVVWDGQGWSPNTGEFSINYRKRTSGSWGTVETIANESSDQKGASIALDSSDDVHVVWYGKGWGVNTTINNIQYRKRTTSWQTQEAITDVADSQTDSAIALDSSDDVHVVWVGTDAFYRKRTTSWQTQENITNDVTISPDFLSIALTKSDIIYMIYTSGSPTYTYLRRRTTVWSDAMLINEGVANSYTSLLWARHPTVSTIRTNVPNNAYAIWEDEGSKVLFGSLSVFPTAATTRITGLIHRYWPGHFRLECILGGGLSGDFSSGGRVELRPPLFWPGLQTKEGLRDFFGGAELPFPRFPEMDIPEDEVEPKPGPGPGGPGRPDPGGPKVPHPPERPQPGGPKGPDLPDIPLPSV
ncbi:hypothetical protein LCGC14_0430800 [marine sediment metagenome]|uniref:Sialidase domain-containing protein n=1 Tax=marine sediment metagenome TaxID=412755 RepID=A0A0F9SMZ0_9ZZZZ